MTKDMTWVAPAQWEEAIMASALSPLEAETRRE
jgi:hypothetical protein